MVAAKLMGKSNGDSQRFDRGLDRNTIDAPAAALLESGQMDMGTHLSDTTTKETIVRIKAWIGELNALLKEYARA